MVRCQCDGGWRPEKKDPPPIKNATSLRQTAVNKIVRNLDELSEEAIRGLPSHLADDVWTTISKYSRRTMRLYSMFAPLISDNCRQQTRYNFSCVCAIPEVPAFFNLTANLPESCSVDLVLCHPGLSRADYRAVPYCHNIRTLVVDPPVPDITGQVGPLWKPFFYQILQGWARAAEEGEAFGKLEMLILDGRELTPGLLETVSAFPALHSIMFLDAQDLDYERNGWKCAHYDANNSQGRQKHDYSRFSSWIPGSIRIRLKHVKGLRDLPGPANLAINILRPQPADRLRMKLAGYIGADWPGRGHGDDFSRGAALYQRIQTPSELVHASEEVEETGHEASEEVQETGHEASSEEVEETTRDAPVIPPRRRSQRIRNQQEGKTL